jgi:hypothetical protein
MQGSELPNLHSSTMKCLVYLQGLGGHSVTVVRSRCSCTSLDNRRSQSCHFMLSTAQHLVSSGMSLERITIGNLESVAVLHEAL